MKYDGRELICDAGPIVAVWDYTNANVGDLGKQRWLCKATDKTLWLYWSNNGKWYSVNSHDWCINLARNYTPVWAKDPAIVNTIVDSKACHCDIMVNGCVCGSIKRYESKWI